MKNQKHDEKTVRAYAVLAQLETQYRVRICEHDHLSLIHISEPTRPSLPNSKPNTG